VREEAGEVWNGGNRYTEHLLIDAVVSERDLCEVGIVASTVFDPPHPDAVFRLPPPIGHHGVGAVAISECRAARTAVIRLR